MSNSVYKRKIMNQENQSTTQEDFNSDSIQISSDTFAYISYLGDLLLQFAYWSRDSQLSSNWYWCNQYSKVMLTED